MAEQLLQQHSPHRRASIGRMRDQVDLTDRPSIIDESAKAPRCLHCGSAHRRATSPAVPSPPPAVPQRIVVPWRLVILVVGVVMTDWAAIKDWAIGRFLEPPPLPPIPAAYDYNAVLNETLRQFEKSLAEDITTPGRFGLERSYKQGRWLEGALDGVSQDYRLLWGCIEETQNQTILRCNDQLNAARNSADELLWGLVNMKDDIEGAIMEASEKANHTASYLSWVLNMPSNEVVHIWGHPGLRFSRRELFFRHLFNLPIDYDDDPELLRNDTLWNTVCDFQAYIIRRNNRLLNYLPQLREMLKASINQFEPAEEFMRKELVIRKDMARVIIEDIHQRYNTSMQEWGASLPNRWYDSSSVLTSVLGWYLDGKPLPTWPDDDLKPHRLNMDNLERAQAGIIFAQAMMRSIEAYLVDSRIRIDYPATRPAEVDANHPCPLRLANADNSTQPQSPHEMLLILEKHVAAFAIQIHSWDEELFHNHVQQAWERREGDLHQGGQSSVLLGARDWLYDLASIARLLI